MSAFHFIAGLPRAGSTLLSAILRQNPRFHAGITTPVIRYAKAIVRETFANPAFKVCVSSARRAEIIRGIFNSYYADAARPVVFDTNRGWAGEMPLLKSIWPEAKVIACVRDVSWVIDSLERAIRKDPMTVSTLFSKGDAVANVMQRATTLLRDDRLVGSALRALEDGLAGEHSDSIMLVEYSDLTMAPRKAMEAIYRFIGEPWFEHDFSNVHFSAEEYDDALRLPGMHDVRGPVRYLGEDETILPIDLFEELFMMNRWR